MARLWSLRSLVAALLCGGFGLFEPAAALAASPTPAPPASVASPQPSPSPSAAPAPSATPFKLVTWSGSADVGLETIFGSKTARFANGVPSRVFDGFHSLSVPVAEAFAQGLTPVEQLPSSLGVPDLQNLNLQASLNGVFGAKFEGSFGSDADAVASNGTSHTDGFDPTQAYLQYAEGPLTVIAGKFESLAGAEVIEAPSASNFNFSRSLLFGLAVPFTHTGARLTYVFDSKVALIAGVNNGWDDVVFQGKGKTFEGSLALTFSPALSATLTTYNGNDCINYVDVYSCVPPFGNRTLYDGTLTLHATPALTLVANYDNGTQLGAALVDPSGASLGAGTARWSGLAAYADYQFSAKFSTALRGEIFRDNGGFRTGYDQLLHEGTVTFGYAPAGNTLLRLEYRSDGSDRPAFAYDGAPPGVGRHVQNSLGSELVVKF